MSVTPLRFWGAVWSALLWTVDEGFNGFKSYATEGMAWQCLHAAFEIAMGVSILTVLFALRRHAKATLA
jgi:hypothetical protein